MTTNPFSRLSWLLRPLAVAALAVLSLTWIRAPADADAPAGRVARAPPTPGCQGEGCRTAGACGGGQDGPACATAGARARLRDGD